MSNDKYLSKPVCTVDVQRDRADGNTFAVAWSSAGHSLPDGPHFLHSQEYVQSLLKRIAELEAERETMHSIEYVSSLLGRIESMAQAHIALQQLCEVYRSAYEEARGIVNTPVKLPQRYECVGYHIDEAYLEEADDGDCFDRDEVIEALTSHGLTVQED